MPCYEEVFTAIHLLRTESSLADCIPAYISTLYVARSRCSLRRAIPSTLPSACWSQPLMQMRKASSFPQSAWLPCPHTRIALNTQAFSGFHVDTIQLLLTLLVPNLPLPFQGTQFLAPELFQTIFCCCNKLSQDDLGRR